MKNNWKDIIVEKVRREHRLAIFSAASKELGDLRDQQEVGGSFIKSRLGLFSLGSSIAAAVAVILFVRNKHSGEMNFFDEDPEMLANLELLDDLELLEDLEVLENWESENA